MLCPGWQFVSERWGSLSVFKITKSGHLILFQEQKIVVNQWTFVVSGKLLGSQCVLTAKNRVLAAPLHKTFLQRYMEELVRKEKNPPKHLLQVLIVGVAFFP